MLTDQELEQAAAALDIAETLFPWDTEAHGFELLPGFFNVYDEQHGQSRSVVYHLESDTIIKGAVWENIAEYSGMYLGTILIENVEYPVRISNSGNAMARGVELEIQEYVRGEPCPCSATMGFNGWCGHANTLADLTSTSCNQAADTHMGNWRISNGEVVIFDF